MAQYFSNGRPTKVQQILRLRRLRGVVAGSFLGGDFDVGVGGDHVVGDRHPLDDLDALADQRVVLHVAHRNEANEALQAEPFDRVGHQLLETRVLDAGDAFGALEILRRGVAAFLALAGVVDQKLCHFAEGAAFLAVVDDDAEAAGLAGNGAFLDAVDQVRTAGADVRAEHVGAVAFVVDAAGDLGAVVRQFCHVAEQVGGDAADRRQKHLEIRACHQFGKHAAGLFEQGAAQIVLGGGKALRHAGQVPHRIDGDLDHGDAAVRMHQFAVMLEPASGDRRLQLGQVEPGAGDGDAGPDVDAFGDFAGEIFRDQMAPRIERDDGLRIAPLRKRPDGCRRVGVEQVRAADRIARAGGNRQRAVDRVGTAMGANHVAVLRPRHRADDRAALPRGRRPPGGWGRQAWRPAPGATSAGCGPADYWT